MKKISRFLLCTMFVGMILTGCGKKGSELVSKTPFPDFSETTVEGETFSNDIFKEYHATIVNFWNNGCGTCIEEMPELEELYHEFQKEDVNLIGVGTDSGENKEQFETAKEILKEKQVTYPNISPDPGKTFYKEFISNLSSYPVTYVVDREGNIVGAPIYGNVKKQLETIQLRIEGLTE